MGTETVTVTKVFVEHEVMFLLGPVERFVVRRRRVDRMEL